MAVVIVGVWSGMLYFATNYDLDCNGKPPHVDWADRLMLMLRASLLGQNHKHTLRSS